MSTDQSHEVKTGIYEHDDFYYRVYGCSLDVHDSKRVVVVMRQDMRLSEVRPLRHVDLEFFLDNFTFVREGF